MKIWEKKEGVYNKLSDYTKSLEKGDFTLHFAQAIIKKISNGIAIYGNLAAATGIEYNGQYPLFVVLELRYEPYDKRVKNKDTGEYETIKAEPSETEKFYCSHLIGLDIFDKLIKLHIAYKPVFDLLKWWHKLTEGEKKEALENRFHTHLLDEPSNLLEIKDANGANGAIGNKGYSNYKKESISDVLTAKEAHLKAFFATLLKEDFTETSWLDIAESLTEVALTYPKQYERIREILSIIYSINIVTGSDKQ